MPDTAAQPLRLFLADLHLDGDATPHALAMRKFLRRLQHLSAVRPVELYLLGDTFDFWDEYHAQVVARYEEDLAAFEAARRAGVRFLLADGNRDFLFGRYLPDRVGAQLLGDGARIPLAPDRAAWVEHGDLICRGDVRYLRYRKRVRSAPLRFIYRLLPWFIARRLVDRVSARSAADCARKAPSDFEPDLDFARARLSSTSSQVLICAHTHKARDEDLGNGRRLIVLPAWCETQAGYRGDAATLSRFLVTPNAEMKTDPEIK